MNMNSILVVGCFGNKSGKLDGQISKTKAIYTMMKDRLGDDVKLDSFNTLSIADSKFRLVNLLYKMIRCNLCIIIPAHRNLEFFFPAAYYLSKIFRYRIINIFVGGWTMDFFLGGEISGKMYSPHPLQMNLCKKCYALLPEVKSVFNELVNKYGFTNCAFFPNFRKINPVLQSINLTASLKLVYFGRIDRMKGYDIIFNLAGYIKKRQLDITISFYGQINPEQESDFLCKVALYPGIVCYGGTLGDDEIIETMCRHDVMLLPTRYFTEGVSGTMLDAYIAGLPIIATEWANARDCIEDGINGFIVPFDNPQVAFNEKVLTFYNDRTLLQTMKHAARESALEFSEEHAWETLSKYIK